MTGTVKSWNEKLGYGFIISPEQREDIYVHATQINVKQSGRKSLREGAAVEFEVTTTEKGLRAMNVRRFHAGTAPHSAGGAN